MSSIAANAASVYSPMPVEIAGAASAGAAVTARRDERAQLIRRTLSALVLAPVALLFIHVGAIWFQLMIAALAVAMLAEWVRLVGNGPSGARPGWIVFGIVYVALPCLTILWLREIAAGRETLMWLAITVWVTDMAAFACGKIIGGPRLLPAISPAKTWAGFLGGLTAAVAVSAVLVAWFGLGSAASGALLGSGVGLVAQGGDLLESALKRRFGVKDTGALIPGHGGVLDRLDAMLTAAPFVAALVWLNGGRLP